MVLHLLLISTDVPAIIAAHSFLIASAFLVAVVLMGELTLKSDV